jgi:type IV fimbrial biogenesis protein FimT
VDHEEGRDVLKRSAGFGLIELMVAVTVLGVLLAVALPNFSSWVSNSRIRTVSEALQGGVRQAQAEAQRRAHTVVFFRTTAKTCTATDVAAAGGMQWQIRTVPNALLTGLTTPEVVQCGVLTDVSSGVTLTGPTTLCFAGSGRQVAATDPGGVGVDCAPTTAAYVISSNSTSAEKRPLQVLVSLGGAIRMCDPGKTLSSTAPDGCPPPP